MKENSLAFISSPYAAVLKRISNEKKAKELIMKIARYGSKLALENGFIPFSPVIAFDEIYTEDNREELMQKCFEAISLSSVFYCVKTDFFKDSFGMQEELEFALKHNILVVDIQFTN